MTSQKEAPDISTLDHDEIDAARSSNLHEATYAKLKEALMDGTFQPGHTFTIRGLASVFGTSVMPVRDALKQLVAERALELLPNRSVALPLMTRTRFQEILQIRLSLESMIATRATPHVTPETIEAMRLDHEHMCLAVKTGDTAAYLTANRSFHFRLYRSANGTVTLPIIESMWMQVGPYISQVFSAHGRATDTVDHHHNAVLKALRRGDASAAGQAIWNDLADAADAILTANWFSRD
ncbi:MAG: GntR family transcriptional regulator [Pigmentiphaga sp.]|nr:GntR family transcriptional regulator [Pigmentiphaga sp.]